MVKQSIDEACELYNLVVEMAPDIAKDHGGIVANFDGYFVHWDEVIKCACQAWPIPMGYSESPLELVTQIIDERDELAEKLRVAELERDHLAKALDGNGIGYIMPDFLPPRRF